MSFHRPPPSTMAAPPLHVGAQGNMMPSYMPPSSTLPPGLPPPPLPPPFPGFPVPLPGQPVLQSSMMQKSDMPMQAIRPPYTRKPHEGYEKKRDYQFRPNVAMSDNPSVTVFVGNITEHASDALIRQLLMKCGIVVNWKRVQGADGKLQAFGFCEYVDAEAGLRAIRLLHDLSVGEKNLVVKVDAKTKAMLEEYKKNKASAMQKPANGQSEDLPNGEEELDEATLTEDTSVKKNITGLLTDNADVLSGKFAGTTNKWKASHSGNEENLEGMGMDKDKKHLISREIRFFRDAYKDSEKDKKDRGKEPEKEYEKENKDRENDRDRDKDRDRDRGKERQRDRNRSQERDSERNRNDERSRDRSRSRDRDRGGREDREKGRQNRELDEDEQYEKRKRERRLKERNQAFVERLKTWEARERKRLREYDRDLEKDREQENELSREKKHLLEFLEDYDDERDDPKYYRGGSFDRRLQARMAEMESDDKDRQRELEEIEEVRKRLGEKAVVEEVSEEAKQEEPPVEIEPETRPTLQATFKPAVHMVESAPKVPSPALESPKNSPKVVNIVAKATQEETTEVDSETTTKKTFGFEMKAKSAVGTSNPNRKKLEAVFNSEEDSLGNQGQKRKLVPLDYSEEEMKAVASSAAKTAEDKKKSIKSLIERIPTAKDELFAYSLDWECVDQSLIDRRIRPWVNKKIVEYIGEEEPSLVDFMCSKLLARSQPVNILRDVSMVLDDEAEVFVVKMWRLLIYETEAKKIGLVK